MGLRLSEPAFPFTKFLPHRIPYLIVCYVPLHYIRHFPYLLATTCTLTLLYYSFRIVTMAVVDQVPEPCDALNWTDLLSMTDVLNALRDAIRDGHNFTYIANGTPIPGLLAATHIQLNPSLVLSKTTPTRWRRPQPVSDAITQPAMDPVAEPQRFFALETLVLCWVTRNESAATYMRQATTEVPVYISLTERKGVIDWLDGKTGDHERIAPLPEGMWLDPAPSDIADWSALYSVILRRLSFL